jgi:hypothetical protein
MRHSSITKLARHPNINDFNLRQHAGWTKTSNMVEVYTHELKGDSLEHVMLAYGVNIKQKRDKTAAQLRQEMVGPHCPFCHKVNIPGALLCASCQRPVSVVSYDSMTKELDGVKRQFEELKKTQEEMINDAVNSKIAEEWLNIGGNNIPQTIERLIEEYFEPDPWDGGYSKEEYARRKRQFPELVKAAKRLQKLRQQQQQRET